MRSIACLAAARQVAALGELRNNTVVKKSEDRTRDLVARAILENGPATAVALAAKLKITPAGVRRHLDNLIAQGLLTAREPFQSSLDSRGRGRPSKVFVMTDDGSLVKEFARSRAEEITKRAAQILANKKNLNEKSEALADFLTKEGYAANNHSQGIGEELCQNHCPIAHVAAQFPEICEAETEAFSVLLGTHVQRLATIAHGDGVCTTFIPNTKNLTKNRERA